MQRRHISSKSLLVVTLSLTALLLTACGGSSVSNTTSNYPVVTGEQGKAPSITAPHGTPPTTLVSKDIYVGTGAPAVVTSTLTVQYTLMAWSTGKVVESSWTSTPATFPLAGVIKGWQEGIPGMKIGGRRLLIIPPSLGYGAAGGGPIGPNETLIFVVDVLAIK
ncbi:MAG TPA: FKBP-type peptidyl-prolyl cis-trans isomerase [archaeon]|nr:FKBP-type peptidyl-prolyl cis-trans isomerase [archaeon]